MKALTEAGALVLAAALTAHSGVTFAQAKSTGSLCNAAEVVLFTCQIETKTVSICGQHRQEGQDGTNAVYRYGQPGRVELEIADLHRAFEGWPGGGETQVYADTPTHRYLVYDRMVRTGIDAEGHSLLQMTQGLLVQRGERIVLKKQCTLSPGNEPPGFNQRQIESLLPQGRYVPH